ncbi:hypothetical protein GMRT_11422 [Giardia muris]|uniref:Uncharacterized protein n=1 Tax=Giardia muris TaxID=5742 RepID=A0A4Z1SQY1_GIAMU|nr:hypothetical protein GMRT_11422 [Giardia muris]|eukprot:TNJ28282.1 hypothetical protein GMRT_11422 [Giardia muris]
MSCAHELITPELKIPQKPEALYMEPQEQKTLQERASLGWMLKSRLASEERIRPLVTTSLEIELNKAFLRPIPCTRLPRSAEIVLGLDDTLQWDFTISRYSDETL